MARVLRAEKLEIVRDLAVLCVRRQIRSRKELVRVAKDEGILRWGESRIFQYVEALRLFGLNKSPARLDTIIPSASAVELAEVKNSGYKTPSLSRTEIGILRRTAFRSEYIRQRFLGYFCPNSKDPPNLRAFRKIAIPVFVTRSYKERRIAGKKIVVRRLCDIDNGIRRFSKVDSNEFLYTIWRWCHSLGLVDKIIVAPDSEIPPNRNYMIFPIKKERVPLSQFERLVRKLYKGGNVVAPIPRLIYKVCSTYFIPVELTKRLIAALVKKRIGKYYLSRAPELLLGKSAYRDSYINLDGYWRSELAMRR
jgi:hypothetical protein